MVIEATCNCIPDPSQEESSSINCQRYELVDQTIINASILAQGECAFELERYIEDAFGEGGCPMLGDRIAGSGKLGMMTIEWVRALSSLQRNECSGG